MATLADDIAAAPRLHATIGCGVRAALGRLVRHVGCTGERSASRGLDARRGLRGPDRLAALVIAPFGLSSLRGRWHLLLAQWRTLVVFGLVAVAAPQFFYFSAVAHMEVAPALLIEFIAPAAVVVWLWLRRGERPGRLTVAGAFGAALGLVLGARPLLGCGTEPAGGALGAGSDGRLRDVLRDVGR